MNGTSVTRRAYNGLEGTQHRRRPVFPPLVLTPGLLISGILANMLTWVTVKHNECWNHSTILMLLKALIVRSTTQKDISLSAPAGTQRCCAARRCICYHLHGTDKLVAIVIEGTVAHGQGGNHGNLLGPLTRFTTSIRHLSIIMSIIWLGTASRQTI